MASPVHLDADTRALIQKLDKAVSHREAHAICQAVGTTLSQVSFDLQDDYLSPSRDGYARRVLHHCRERDYSVMVMVWAAGQGTPIHDHAGKWCVECVMKGQIEITSYRPTDDPESEVVHFATLNTVTANVREVGILVPPNEYHRIRNVADETAMTVHVYQGEMLWCHRFHELASGGYRRDRCELTFT